MTELAEADGTNSRGEDESVPPTIKIDVTPLQRTIQQTETALAEVRGAAAAQAAITQRLQQQLEASIVPLADLSRQMEAMFDAHQEQVQGFAKAMERTLQAAIVPSLEMKRVQQALAAPARLAKTLTNSRIEMASVVEAALQARPTDVGVADTAETADRILEEVAGPPVGETDADGLRFLVERVCVAGERLGLDRGHVVTIVVAVLIALVQGRCDVRRSEVFERTIDRRFDRVERQLHQSLEVDRRTLDKVEILVVDETSNCSAGPDSNESETASQRPGS